VGLVPFSYFYIMYFDHIHHLSISLVLLSLVTLLPIVLLSLVTLPPIDSFLLSWFFFTPNPDFKCKKKFYNSCLSDSGLLHLTWSSPVPSIFPTSDIISSFFLIYCIYTLHYIFFIHSLVDGHLRWFCDLTGVPIVCWLTFLQICAQEWYRRIT
jgi:hypothetical protein